VFAEFRLVGPKGTDRWKKVGVGGRITVKWTGGI
jgi:hypothetical protein